MSMNATKRFKREIRLFRKAVGIRERELAQAETLYKQVVDTNPGLDQELDALRDMTFCRRDLSNMREKLSDVKLALRLHQMSPQSRYETIHNI